MLYLFNTAEESKNISNVKICTASQVPWKHEFSIIHCILREAEELKFILPSMYNNISVSADLIYAD